MLSGDSDPPRYGLLGPLVVRVGGRGVSVGGQKPRAVLIRLLLEPGTLVSVDTLVEAVWENQAPLDAVKNVQIYVARMRKVLPDGLLVSGTSGYLAHCAPDEVDALRYQALVDAARAANADGRQDQALERFRAAESLWRGDVLADVRYATFAQSAIAYYEQLHDAVRDDEIAIRLDLGHGAELIPQLEKLLRDEPLRERRWGHLMVAYYQGGRQTDALRTFERMRTTFLEEMGLDPSPEIRRLEQRILDHDPVLAGVSTARPSRVPPTAVDLVAVVTDGAAEDEDPRIVCRGGPSEVLAAAVDVAELAGRNRVAIGCAIGKVQQQVEPLLRVARPGEVVISQEAHTALLSAGNEPRRFVPAGWTEFADGGARAVYHYRRVPTEHTGRTPVSRAVLPSYRNAFLGREDALQSLGALLESTGAVTVVGPGGIGKTRLAVEFASTVGDQFPDGVWLVDLADVERSEALWSKVVEALALVDPRPSPRSIAEALAVRRMLIVFDNCEHIANAVAELIDELTTAARAVATIATSRTRLGNRSERAFVVDALDWNGRSGAPAVALLEARAEELAVPLNGSRLLTELCAAVAGMPLAIELAVAQLGHLTVPQLLARMNDQLRLLSGNATTPRHRSIRAVFESSFELLSPSAQDALLTSAVFRGSFDLDEAAAVHGDNVEPEARELVAASLWVTSSSGDTMRYRQLEPIRQCSYARLVVSGHHVDVHRRHAEYFISLAGDHLVGLRPLRDLAAALANLTAAYDWSRIAQRNDLAARIATAMLSITAIIPSSSDTPARQATSEGELA